MNPRAIVQQLAAVFPAHLRRHPLGYLLSLFSIVLAVALFVSMRTTQASILATFRGNMKALAGNADVQITAPQRLTADDLKAIEKIPGLRAAPLVQTTAAVLPSQQAVAVLGIDLSRDARLRQIKLADHVALDLRAMLSAKRDVVVPRSLATTLDHKTGDTLRLAGPSGLVPFTIVGLLNNDGPAAALGGNIVFMDLAAAQSFAGRQGFDRIDVAFDDPAARAALERALPPNARLQPAESAGSTFGYVYSQMQTVLGCISLLACVIGLFIVYNTMSLSVVQRSRLIGTLRALGARRLEILAVFTSEAALTGLVASILGALLGRALADHALQTAAATLTITLDLGTPRLIVPLDAWIVAPLIGILAAVGGALMPSRAAALVPPVVAMKPFDFEQRLALRAGRWFLAGLVLIAACFALVLHPRTNWQPTIIGVLLGVFGVAMIGPQLLAWTRPLAQRALERVSSVPGHLAVDNLFKFPTRTSLTLVALAGSLAIVVAVKATIAGLQQEVDHWMSQVFVFDLTAQMNDLSSTPYPTSSFPESLRDEVFADPRCETAYGVRTIFLPFRGDEIMLIAYDASVFHDLRIARGRGDSLTDRKRAEALRNGMVHLSSNFARIHGLRPGDRVTLPTPAGPRDFDVDGLQTDYSWFRGTVFMDLDVYRRLWNDSSLSYLDIKVRPGADQEALRADLGNKWIPRDGVFVHSVDRLRDRAGGFLNDWFRLADLQLLLGVIVGGTGVANTLLISVLSQTRQIGLLRAVGASTAQAQRVLAVEAALLGLAGGILGCAGGVATVALLVAPMTIKATGFLLPIIIPWSSMAGATVAAVAIALAASLLPRRAVRRIDIIQAIGYE